MNKEFEGSIIEPNEKFCLIFDELLKDSNDFLKLLLNYTNNLVENKITSKLDNKTTILIFNYCINYSASINDAKSGFSFYKYYLLYLINNLENPFNESLIKVPLEFEKDANFKAINKIILNIWNSNLENNNAYINILSNMCDSNEKELLKFLNDENYKANLNFNKLELTQEILETLQIYFNKLYFDGYTEAASEILNIMPYNWKNLWNKHLCNTYDNNVIDELITVFNKQKYLVEHQNILILQLQIKQLINFIETAFEDYSNIDENIISKINQEISFDLSKLQNIDDELAVNLFTQKLFKYVIFDKAVDLLNAIPKKTSREQRVALYIDLKQIFEACIENEIETSQVYLESINKILFEELRDKTSGTNLVIQMLNNKNQKGLSQYIKNLSLILDANSLEMESLFETLILFINKNPLQKKLYHTYYNIFEEITYPQFTILKELLITFNKDEENIASLAKSIVENSNIFKPHSQTFYILIDAVFSRKFKLETHQLFSALILNSNLNTILSRNFIFLLIDHFYEQPYRDFKKDFPHITLNYENINKYLEILNDTKFSYYNFNKSYLDFIDKSLAVEKARDYLLFLLKKSHVKKELPYEHQCL